MYMLTSQNLATDILILTVQLNTIDNLAFIIKNSHLYKFTGVHYLELEHVHNLLYWLTCLCYDGLETVHSLSAETHEVLRCPLNAGGDNDKSKVYVSLKMLVNLIGRTNFQCH